MKKIAKSSLSGLFAAIALLLYVSRARAFFRRVIRERIAEPTPPPLP